MAGAVFAARTPHAAPGKEAQHTRRQQVQADGGELMAVAHDPRVQAARERPRERVRPQARQQRRAYCGIDQREGIHATVPVSENVAHVQRVHHGLA